jgi:hypothetical protein
MAQNLTEEEELVYNIGKAQQHAKKALDICYKPNGDCQRSLWYKMTLGRAQSILMSLLVRELGNQSEDLSRRLMAMEREQEKAQKGG